jgi:hypothetical protein
MNIGGHMTERHGGRDIAILHAVHALDMQDRARGDETSPFMILGSNALALARDEARQLKIDPDTLVDDAKQARVVFQANERKVLSESFPNVAPRPLPDRDEFGFPYQPSTKRRGW